MRRLVLLRPSVRVSTECRCRISSIKRLPLAGGNVNSYLDHAV